ncbi:oligosaccharide flippase family protein [Candidatus Roizmanbacteria bacterium]|nr:oligosaccharide flippase family protein [Candidatus Roizmanbacteria bacterium]
MAPRLLAFITRPTTRHIIINTLGNYLNVFFTALFALILVRILSPSQYGVLSVLLGIAYVLANVLDFGTTATIYSYLPPLLEKRSTNDLYRFVKSTFYYQSLFSLIVIGVLFVAFPYLDSVFFKTGAPVWELYLTAISVLLFIWQNFITNCLFAAKRFLKANIYINLSNLLKTLVILYLVFMKTVSVGSIIFVFGILGPILFFLFLFLEKKDLIFVLMKSGVSREEFRFGYTVTYFFASQFFNLGLRMDLFLLSYFQLKADVGFYGLAQKIILTIITTVISITQVLSPSFSNVKKKSEIVPHLKTGFLYLLLPTGLFILLMLTPDIIFKLFFTDTFSKTAPITRVLAIPFIIYAVGNLPQLFLLYTVKKPRPILYANIVFFILLTVGCYYLIPKMGVFGPPYAITIAMAVSIFMMVIASVLEYRKMENDPATEKIPTTTPATAATT